MPLDPSQVEDQRGRGGLGSGLGGPIVVGGGGIGLVILIIALLLGVNPLSDYSGTNPTIDGAPSLQDCQTGADANKRDDCRIVGFVDSIQKYWTDELTRRGDTYLPAKTVLYTGAAQGACGLAQTAMGPFYCPEDEKVYLDISFFQELTRRFGAKGGPFAQGYVVAHEYGHHVQNQRGLLSSSQGGGNAVSVRVELQADCLAGVWARHAADTGFLEAPTDAEIAQALDAAASVGDDRIQQETQGRVQPEKWTHGSAAQRQQWFKTGYQTGDLDRCDTSGVSGSPRAPTLGNAWRESAVSSFVNAYLWYTDGNLRHHLRAESVDEARERIAATHGDDVARRAVIRSLETNDSHKSQSAAA